MNRFLASIIGLLNGFIALVFILGGGVIGHSMSESYGLALGLVCGLIVAILVCGFLAIFISMRAELVEIRRLIESRPIQVNIKKVRTSEQSMPLEGASRLLYKGIQTA